MKKILACICATVMLLSACGSGGARAPMAGGLKSEAATDNMVSSAPQEPMEAPMPSPESAPAVTLKPEYGSVSGAGESVYQRADAKLIRRCTVELQTTEFDAAVSALYELVEKQGGYFENSSVYGGGYYNANARRNGEYVVRVPADKYNAFRSSVGDLGYISFSNESTEDIGEQYYDTEARLKTLRTKQERLLILLEKAENMEDIISLESALGDVEYEIERYSSTLNRYDGLVNFATFHININEVIRVEEKTGQADTLGDRMRAAFVSGLEDLKYAAEDFMVWLSYNVFALAGWLVVICVVVTVIRRKKWKLPRIGRRKKKEEIEEI